MFTQLSESMDDEFLPVGLVCIGDDNKTSFLYTPIVANHLMVAMLEAAVKSVKAQLRVTH